MSEYLQQLFADLPEAVRHAVVLQLQQVVQSETLITAISTNLGAAGHIESRLPNHVESNPPVPADELLANTLESPESGSRCYHTRAGESSARQRSQECPPLLTDPDSLWTTQLLNTRTALRKRLLLCRTSTRLWDLYVQTHRCTT